MMVHALATHDLLSLVFVIFVLFLFASPVFQVRILTPVPNLQVPGGCLVCIVYPLGREREGKAGIKPFGLSSR